MGALCFGFEIANFTLTIDDNINVRNSVLSDKNANVAVVFSDFHYTIGLIKILFVRFTCPPPFYSTFLATLLLLGAAVVFIIFIEKCSINSGCRELSCLSKILFCGMFISVPFVVAEYMSFISYNIEISLGMLFCGLSVMQVQRYLQTKQKITFITAAILLVLSVGIYQSYISVFIAATLVYLLFSLFSAVEFKTLMKSLWCFICVFLLSILGYFIFGYAFRSFISTSRNYIQTYSSLAASNTLLEKMQIAWNGIVGNFNMAQELGMNFWVFMLFIALGAALISLFYCKTWWRKLFAVLFLSALSFSPFFVSFFTLSYGFPLRALQGFMFTIPAVWLLFIILLAQMNRGKLLSKLIITIGLIVMISQQQLLSMAFSSNYVRAQNDSVMVQQIVQRIEYETQQKVDKPIYVMMPYYTYSTPTRLVGQVTGASMLPYSHKGLYALGYQVTWKPLGQEDWDKYKDIIGVWPAQNSILYEEERIIVRLT